MPDEEMKMNEDEFQVIKSNLLWSIDCIFGSLYPLKKEKEKEKAQKKRLGLSLTHTLFFLLRDGP